MFIYAVCFLFIIEIVNFLVGTVLQVRMIYDIDCYNVDYVDDDHAKDDNDYDDDHDCNISLYFLFFHVNCDIK
jgi:hypothetical protein